MTTFATNQSFQRRSHNRILGGVSGALAERFEIDITAIRIAFIALAVLGGGGILLYAAGWLFMPDESADESIAADLMKSLGWHW